MIYQKQQADSDSDGGIFISEQLVLYGKPGICENVSNPPSTEDEKGFYYLGLRFWLETMKVCVK